MFNNGTATALYFLKQQQKITNHKTCHSDYDFNVCL